MHTHNYIPLFTYIKYLYVRFRVGKLRVTCHVVIPSFANHFSGNGTIPRAAMRYSYVVTFPSLVRFLHYTCLYISGSAYTDTDYRSHFVFYMCLPKRWSSTFLRHFELLCSLNSQSIRKRLNTREYHLDIHQFLLHCFRTCNRRREIWKRD